MIKKPRTRKYYNPQNEDQAHPCDHPGCPKAGEYRAPKDRRLRDYYWFCLEHVQEYNARWNYYDGISDEPPEDEQPKRTRMRFRHRKSNIKYNYGAAFSADDLLNNDFSRIDSAYYTAEERAAIRVMEMSAQEMTLANLKKQYKKLVKKYHPDVNRNDPEAEEKFKRLSIAYQYLLQRFG